MDNSGVEDAAICVNSEGSRQTGSWKMRALLENRSEFQVDNNR
jgi:hypothetical protein